MKKAPKDMDWKGLVGKAVEHNGSTFKGTLAAPGVRRFRVFPVLLSLELEFTDEVEVVLGSDYDNVLKTCHKWMLQQQAYSEALKEQEHRNARLESQAVQYARDADENARMVNNARKLLRAMQDSVPTDVLNGLLVGNGGVPLSTWISSILAEGTPA